jgi:plastocyanin
MVMTKWRCHNSSITLIRGRNIMNKRILGAAVVAAIVLIGASLGANAFASAPQYAPQTRTMTLTAVPLAVHEMQGTLDYLKEDFATGGILDGKEVYGFYPSTVTVIKGDTVNLSLVNPADDEHTFTVSGMGVNVIMKGNSVAHTTFVAKQTGIFSFYCNMAEHFPYMWGQIVVLPTSTATGE